MTPEFLRRYYILKIISKPTAFGIYNTAHVPLERLQKALNDKREDNKDNKLYEKLESHNAKTIKRDLVSIREYFGVEISLKRNYGFYIDDFEHTKDLEHIYEKTELFLLNNKSHEWKDVINAEESSLNGSIDINSLVNAIDQKKMIHIIYDGWFDDGVFNKIEACVQPLLIKEANRAWYLIAYSEKIGVYSFCLDSRLRRMIVTSKKASDPYLFNKNEYFKNTIGILKEGINPEKIRLKVANHHLRYLIDRPLHHSQKIISYPVLPETETLDYSNPEIWGTIEIYLEPNYEFIMEILKFKEWIYIVSPKRVVNMIVSDLKNIMAYYQ